MPDEHEPMVEDGVFHDPDAVAALVNGWPVVAICRWCCRDKEQTSGGGFTCGCDYPESMI